MRERYGPGPGTYIATVLGVALIGLVPGAWEEGPGSVILLSVILLAMGLPGWVWYEVDERELRRSGLLGSRTVGWEDIGGVKGRRVSTSKSVSSVLIQRVVDHDGFTLFKLNPFLGRRRELVRRILKEVSTVRKRSRTRDGSGRGPDRDTGSHAGGSSRRSNS